MNRSMQERSVRHVLVLFQREYVMDLLDIEQQLNLLFIFKKKKARNESLFDRQMFCFLITPN